MPILFDTGACELLRRRDRRAERLALDFYPPVLCTHVVGEYLYGQMLSEVTSNSLLAAREFLESFEVYLPDLRTASIYARLRAHLRRGGKILPDPDYWIAAHAVQENLALVSTDKDFERIPEVKLHYLAPNA